MAAPPGALRLVDFGSSLFWTLAGVVSVGATVTAINQRVRAQVGAAGRPIAWATDWRGWGRSGSMGAAQTPPRRAAPSAAALLSRAPQCAARRRCPAPAQTSPASAPPHPQEEHVALLRERNALAAELCRCGRGPGRCAPSAVSGAALHDTGGFTHWSLKSCIPVCCSLPPLTPSVQRCARPDHNNDLETRRAQGDAGAARSKLQLLEQQLEGASGYWWRPLGEQLARTAAAAPPGGQQQAAAAAASSGGSSRPAQR